MQNKMEAARLADIHILERMVENYHVEFNKKEKANSSLKEQIKTLQEQLQNKEKEKSELMQQLKSSKKDADNLREALVKEQNRACKLFDKQNLLKEESEQRLVDAKKDFDKKFEAQEQKIEEMQQKLADSKKDIEEEKKRMKKTRVSLLKEKVTELEETLNNKEKEHQKEVKALQGKILDLSDSISNHEKEMRNLESSWQDKYGMMISKFMSQLTSTENEVRGLKHKLSLYGGIDAVFEKIQLYEEQLAENEKTIELKNSEIQFIRHSNKKILEVKKSIQTKHSLLVATSDIMQETLKKLEEENAEIIAVKEMAVEDKNIMMGLYNEMDSCRKTITEKFKNSELENKRLNEEIRKLKSFQESVRYHLTKCKTNIGDYKQLKTAFLSFYKGHMQDDDKYEMNEDSVRGIKAARAHFESQMQRCKNSLNSKERTIRNLHIKNTVHANEMVNRFNDQFFEIRGLHEEQKQNRQELARLKLKLRQYETKGGVAGSDEVESVNHPPEKKVTQPKQKPAPTKTRQPVRKSFVSFATKVNLQPRGSKVTPLK